ncbi:uncharacterized protein LOC120287401 [Eucalyptus grandis]|uniref:uncharacterized protein LOC120287401 n=1 Tax=Eucalyptus grandis TaxID=71139 RepID=UPI00192EC658|nr:uncharacterized protein LOC120287401 [Eucalyptus grandis]
MMRGTSRFGKKGKLSSKYVGSFVILEIIGTLAYRLALSLRLAQVYDVFHVLMLRKYEPDSTHVLNFEELYVDNRVSYVKRLVQIVDRKEQVLRTKTISLVKVVWQHHGIEAATWESEESTRQQYPHLF